MTNQKDKPERYYFSDVPSLKDTPFVMASEYEKVRAEVERLEKTDLRTTVSQQLETIDTLYEENCQLKQESAKVAYLEEENERLTMFKKRHREACIETAKVNSRLEREALALAEYFDLHDLPTSAAVIHKLLETIGNLEGYKALFNEIADQRDDAQAASTAYKTEIETLIAKRDELQAKIKAHEAEATDFNIRIDQLLAINTEDHRRRIEAQAELEQFKGSIWHWESDGDNDLESLTCPVLIKANDLRQLLADARQQAFGECETAIKNFIAGLNSTVGGMDSDEIGGYHAGNIDAAKTLLEAITAAKDNLCQTTS